MNPVGTETAVEQDDAATAAPTAARAPQRQQGKAIDYKGAGKRLMDRCVADARNNQPRLDRDRQDWQNLLFYRGGQSQWTVYDRATNSYVPRGADPEQGGLPDWVPRPATNIFGVKIDQIASLLDQSDPAKVFGPSTDDDADRATAEVAEDAIPVLLDEIGYDSARSRMNKLITLTNGCALIVHYDNDPKYGVEEIDLLRCPTCALETTPMELEDAGNVCPGEDEDTPGCGTSGDDFQPVIDPKGKPVGIPYAKGKVCGTVIPSFEYSLPSGARVHDAKLLPWILTHSTMPKADVIARWPMAKDAIGKGSGQKAGGIQRSYARGMRQLSAPSRAGAPVAVAGGGTVGAAGADDPVIYLLFHDPIDDGEFYFPDGLHCVMVDDTPVEYGPLPFTDDEDRAVKNVLLRSYAHAPGTAFGKPPADDLVPLQVTYNLVDSLIQLILMHDAAPRVFIPLSVTLENQPSGRPGENVYYRSTVPGEKPTTENGINPPEGLYKYLDIIKANFEEVSKLNSVLAGARPEGDPTLGEVQRLEENGMRSFKEPLDQLVGFETDLTRLLFFIAKRSAWSDRFRRIRGDNGQWDIKQFNAADLNGQIDIQIDKASAYPKSQLMRMLRIQKALEMGVLPPAMQDPELQTKLLIELDLVSLKPSLDADRKQIARELDRWRGAHTPDEIAPPDPACQELPLHLFFKRQFVKTEEFEELRKANAPVAQAMLAHIQQIQMLMQPPAPPAPPDTRSPVEKGDRSAVDAAVSSGAIRPAGGEPKPDALGAAVSSGALMPAGAVPQPQPGPSIDDLMEAGALAPAPPEQEGGAPPQ